MQGLCQTAGSLCSPSRISLPRKGCRVGLRIVLFEDCSAFTRVTACTLALSPIRDTLLDVLYVDDPMVINTRVTFSGNAWYTHLRFLKVEYSTLISAANF